MAQRFPSHIFNAHPLTKRLGSVQEALKRIAEASSKGERNQGFHDAAFWAGRTIADVLNHNKNPEGEGNLYHETLNAIFSANEPSAKEHLGNLPTSSSHPYTITASVLGGPLLIALASRYNAPKSAVLAVIGLAVSYWGLSHWPSINMRDNNGTV
jgi:hypothetical protein